MPHPFLQVDGSYLRDYILRRHHRSRWFLQTFEIAKNEPIIVSAEKGELTTIFKPDELVDQALVILENMQLKPRDIHRLKNLYEGIVLGGRKIAYHNTGNGIIQREIGGGYEMPYDL